jgi:pSer/pThr/pTyr-binding forkhead associated (FHA) protein
MKMNDPRGSVERRHATVLESVEEVRALARQGATVREALPTTQGSSLPLATGVLAPTEPFRPADRPSMALLTVVDDGDESGELVRIRAATFVIGRVEGDLVIPHDVGISGRHAEISRRAEGGAARYRWYLRDLQSTNGTFARASSLVLHHGQEFLIGRTRFRFEMISPLPAAAMAEAARPAALATRKWQEPPQAEVSAPARPCLVELTADGVGRRVPLLEAEIWIGRAPGSKIVVADPTVDPQHARVFRDPKGRWVVANARSQNGVWARVDEIALEHGGQFQCGEQRFLITIL